MLETVFPSYEKISEPFQINNIKKRSRVCEFSNVILSIIYWYTFLIDTMSPLEIPHFESDYIFTITLWGQAPSFSRNSNSQSIYGSS